MNYLMLDTETANDINNPLAYDISWIIYDENFKELKRRAFVNYDVYVLEKELMQTSYYAHKLPKYEMAIKNGEKKLATLKTINKKLAKDLKKYNAVVVAHNAIFDYRSCNTTLRYITKSENRFFFPYGTEIWDTLTMAREVFSKNPDYYRFCLYHDFMTKNEKPQLTAEVLYRFLSNNEDFEEEHIGIDDCEIEIEILKECLKRKPDCRKSPWKS